ncbi:hypothetical protein LXT21_36410 [Myxococcus sp. K38C18041901]|uniref:hypothetical protein n=1 Tax=Myxococcus guangdongensis TaxID=2906760 RepID=UPI0020A772AD|nr:hypothetical protein [Myxococcus guangdongensis]MCP3064269.1 hypothetical protein [Myxococcus guangdongensis]
MATDFSLPTKEEFCSRVERGLANYPALAACVPRGYVELLSAQRNIDFEAVRTSRYLHNTTLPLSLYLIGAAEEVFLSLPRRVGCYREIFIRQLMGAQELARQLLGFVERFLVTFESTPGRRNVVSPLWNAGLDRNDPIFWSVVAHSVRAWDLHLAGARILGFEVRTGTRDRTADIHYMLSGQEVFLDIEMWHGAEPRRTSQFREEVSNRIRRKVEYKFASLVPHAVGVIEECCFPTLGSFAELNDDRSLLEPVFFDDMPRCGGGLSLIVGIADPSGQLQGVQFVTRKSPLIPRLVTSLTTAARL